MVSGVYGYSGQDIYRQQAQKRAAEWAQRSAAQLQAAQGQQAGQVQYAQQPQQGYVQYAQPTQQVQQPEGCTDGKDDGKIGFWEGLKSFGKGALKFVGGLVGFDQNGNWSLGRALKNVAIGAGIIAIGALTGGTAFIIGAGVATAGAGLVTSQYQFWTAKTDADAKAAMEGTGSNALALGLALTGAKGVMSKVNPTKNYNGFTGTLKAGWDSVNLLPTKVFNGIKSGYQAYKAGGWSGVKSVANQSIDSSFTQIRNNWNGIFAKNTQTTTNTSTQSNGNNTARTTNASTQSNGNNTTGTTNASQSSRNTTQNNTTTQSSSGKIKNTFRSLKDEHTYMQNEIVRLNRLRRTKGLSTEEQTLFTQVKTRYNEIDALLHGSGSSQTLPVRIVQNNTGLAQQSQQISTNVPTSSVRVAQNNTSTIPQTQQVSTNNATSSVRVTQNSGITGQNVPKDYIGAIFNPIKNTMVKFNNMYDKVNIPYISGRRIPFTQVTVPSIGKAWTIPATLVNPSVGGPSLNDIALKELQYEQIGQIKSQLMQQGYTEAQATALINQAMSGGGATQAATAQAQYTTPQFGQYTTGQAPFGMNLQNLDYQMKSLNLI